MQFSEQLTTLYVESYTFKSEKYYNCVNTDQVLIKGNLLTDNECYFHQFQPLQLRSHSQNSEN
jgi:hypothetical protein